MRPRSSTIEASSVEEYIEKSRRELNLSQHNSASRSRGQPSLRFSKKSQSAPLTAIEEEETMIETEEQTQENSLENNTFETYYRRISETEHKNIDKESRTVKLYF